MQTELLTDPGHIREDLRQMEAAVKRSVKNPEIPIPAAVIEAMPKVAGTILLKGGHREQLRAGQLLLAFMEYNKSANTDRVQNSCQTINVGVQIDQNASDAGRNLASQVLARITAGEVSDVISSESQAANSR